MKIVVSKSDLVSEKETSEEKMREYEYIFLTNLQKRQKALRPKTYIILTKEKLQDTK